MKKQTKVMATLSTAALLALGFSAVSIDLSKINWSNYVLVVIDESHNFRLRSSSSPVSGFVPFIDGTSGGAGR